MPPRKIQPALVPEEQQVANQPMESSDVPGQPKSISQTTERTKGALTQADFVKSMVKTSGARKRRGSDWKIISPPSSQNPQEASTPQSSRKIQGLLSVADFIAKGQRDTGVERKKRGSEWRITIPTTEAPGFVPHVPKDSVAAVPHKRQRRVERELSAKGAHLATGLESHNTTFSAKNSSSVTSVPPQSSTTSPIATTIPFSISSTTQIIELMPKAPGTNRGSHRRRGTAHERGSGATSSNRGRSSATASIVRSRSGRFASTRSAVREQLGNSMNQDEGVLTSSPPKPLTTKNQKISSTTDVGVASKLITSPSASSAAEQPVTEPPLFYERQQGSDSVRSVLSNPIGAHPPLHTFYPTGATSAVPLHKQTTPQDVIATWEALDGAFNPDAESLFLPATPSNYMFHPNSAMPQRSMESNPTSQKPPNYTYQLCPHHAFVLNRPMAPNIVQFPTPEYASNFTYQPTQIGNPCQPYCDACSGGRATRPQASLVYSNDEYEAEAAKGTVPVRFNGIQDWDLNYYSPAAFSARLEAEERERDEREKKGVIEPSQFDDAWALIMDGRMWDE